MNSAAGLRNGSKERIVSLVAVSSREGGGWDDMLGKRRYLVLSRPSHDYSGSDGEGRNRKYSDKHPVRTGEAGVKSQHHNLII